ncbi:MAG: DUF4272 domain-containing protein [Marinicella sp.]
MFGNSINPQKIKKQNTKLLKKLGIDVIDHLPWIEPQPLRSAHEIASRCVLLAALLQLNFEAPNDFIAGYIKENGLWEYMTHEEEQILETNYDNLTEQEKINLYWNIETVWALAWVGKKHNVLTFNTGVENSLADMLPNFQQNESAENFINNFSIRKEKEIFIELDKFYRAHWFARNLDLNGKTSPAVNMDFIMERRKALEWVANANEDWDEISLDT